MVSTILEQFILSLEWSRKNTCSTLAALTLCLYDTILSSGDEIKYIWGSKWSSVKVLYFIARYYGIISLIALLMVFAGINPSDGKTCQRFFFWIIPGGATVMVVCVDAILLLRVYALYNCNMRIFTALLVLVLADFGVILAAAIKTARYVAANVIEIPGPWKGCATAFPELGPILAAYVLNCALSFLFLGMTLWKLLDNHRRRLEKLTWRALFNTENVSPLLLAFVRDGSIFFALVSIASIVGVLLPYAVDGQERSSLFPWGFALYSYSGAHLILNLRIAGAKGGTNSTWNDTLPLQHGPGGFTQGPRFGSSIPQVREESAPHT